MCSGLVIKIDGDERTYFETQPTEVILAELAVSWSRLQRFSNDVVTF
jgi:hypothetical protein